MIYQMIMLINVDNKFLYIIKKEMISINWKQQKIIKTEIYKKLQILFIIFKFKL